MTPKLNNPSKNPLQCSLWGAINDLTGGNMATALTGVLLLIAGYRMVQRQDILNAPLTSLADRVTLIALGVVGGISYFNYLAQNKMEENHC